MAEKKVSMDKLFAEMAKLQDELKVTQESITAKRQEITSHLESYGLLQPAKRRASGPRAPKGAAAKAILAVVAAKGSVTTAEIREACSMTSSQAQPVLTALVKKGLISSSGRGMYVVTALGQAEATK